MHPAQNASPDHCFHETPKQNARKTSPSEVCVKVFGTNWDQTAVWSTCKSLKTGGQGRNRTADASLFRAGLVQGYRIQTAKLRCLQYSLLTEKRCPQSSLPQLVEGDALSSFGP